MEIKVYGNCPECTKLKGLLTAAQVPFEGFSLDMDVAKQYGAQSQPIVLVDKVLVVKLNHQEYFNEIKKRMEENAGN